MDSLTLFQSEGVLLPMAHDGKLNPAGEKSIERTSPYSSCDGRTRSPDCIFTSSSLVHDKNEELPCKSSFRNLDSTSDRRMQHVLTLIER